MIARFPFLGTMSLVALLGGCTVGPDYAGPPTAAPRAAAARTFARGDASDFVGQPPLARWWEGLDDPILNRLEDHALAASPDLAAAEARVRRARAALREQRADELPTVSGSALYAHAHIPGLALGSSGGGAGQSGGGGTSDFNIYNLGFNASWEVDLFGGQRRAIEAARATVAAGDASLADVQVSLTADIAQAYLAVRDRQQRIALNQQSLALLEQIVALTRQRFAQGTASRLDVERLNRQRETTLGQATPLNAELDVYLDAIATLAGAEPGTLDGLIGTGGAIPLPPAQVAVGDPAALLQRRPDIRAAERTLAADSAKIGQARAARFPRLSIMGIVGIGGSRPSDLTQLDDFTALVAPQLSWSFLDFGRNAAKVRQAEAVRDEAEAKYRSVVLAALRDASDALSRFRYGRVTVAALARAHSAAGAAESASAERYAAGTGTLIDLLAAQRERIATAQALAQAEAMLTGEYVGIQKAIGLGWSERSTPSVASAAAR